MAFVPSFESRMGLTSVTLGTELDRSSGGGRSLAEATFQTRIALQAARRLDVRSCDARYSAPPAVLDVEDRGLMRGVLTRDPAALRSLFDRYAPTGMALAQRILGQPQLAELAVRDAFLSVWRDPGRYRAESGSVRSWLIAVLHRQAIELLRGDRPERRTDASRSALGLEAYPLSVATVLEAPMDPTIEQIGQRARGTVERLPGREREILELMYFGGLSQSEVAAALQIPLRVVKSRCLRGMRRLRGEITDPRRL